MVKLQTKNLRGVKVKMRRETRRMMRKPKPARRENYRNEARPDDRQPEGSGVHS